MQKPWFKRKMYGLGWYPSTWQGWLILAIYIVLLVKVVVINHFKPGFDGNLLISVVVPWVILTAVFVWIYYITGEKPHWQWGKKDTERKKD